MFVLLVTRYATVVSTRSKYIIQCTAGIRKVAVVEALVKLVITATVYGGLRVVEGAAVTLWSKGVCVLDQRFCGI